MKRNREELTRIHKEKCKELKAVRAKIAEDLGIDLHQRECTYEGYCSGTCPKCKQEELMLNAAILKKQLEASDMKRRVAAVGLTAAAAVSLSGCSTLINEKVEEIWEAIDGNMTEGIAPAIEMETISQLEGALVPVEETVEALESDIAAPEPTVEELEGDVAFIESEETMYELAGEISYEGEIYYEEACDVENTDENGEAVE